VTLCRVACLVEEQRRGGASDDPRVAGGTWLPAVGSSSRRLRSREVADGTWLPTDGSSSRRLTPREVAGGTWLPAVGSSSRDSLLKRWLAGLGSPQREVHPENSQLER
jgi:hypothetical protein